MVAGYPAAFGSCNTSMVSLAPADDDNTDPTSRVDRGTRIEILMNLINSNTYVILPFGQLAALIGLTWLAFVAYQCVRGIITAWEGRVVREVNHESLNRLDAMGYRRSDHGNGDRRVEPAAFSIFSDDEKGTW